MALQVILKWCVGCGEVVAASSLTPSSLQNTDLNNMITYMKHCITCSFDSVCTLYCKYSQRKRQNKGTFFSGRIVPDPKTNSLFYILGHSSP